MPQPQPRPSTAPDLGTSRFPRPQPQTHTLHPQARRRAHNQSRDGAGRLCWGQGRGGLRKVSTCPPRLTGSISPVTLAWLIAKTALPSRAPCCCASPRSLMPKRDPGFDCLAGARTEPRSRSYTAPSLHVHLRGPAGQLGQPQWGRGRFSHSTSSPALARACQHSTYIPAARISGWNYSVSSQPPLTSTISGMLSQDCWDPSCPSQKRTENFPPLC